jgi:hypothetical protein
MSKLALTLLLTIFFANTYAQVNLSPNVLAEPFQGQHFKLSADNDVEGSPLLFDDWKAGEVTLKNGEIFRLQKINFDASRSQFIYTQGDTIYDFFDNVKQIKIFGDSHAEDPTPDMVFIKDILPGKSIFVQVLAKGKITILREIKKAPEGENYSNGIVNSKRKYTLHTEDVALVNGKPTPFKYSSSSLEDLASDKKDQVASYVKANNLKPKKQIDFLKSIDYYNSINTAIN